MHFELLGKLDDRNAGLLDETDQSRQSVDVARAENDVDPRSALHHTVTVLLGLATADGDLQSGSLLDRFQPPEVAVQLVVGVLAYRAGVEDRHLSVLSTIDPDVAGDFHQSGHALGVVLVHLTAMRLEVEGTSLHCGSELNTNAFLWVSSRSPRSQTICHSFSVTGCTERRWPR